MTRKTALHKAILILSQIKDTEEVCEKLKDLSEELPLNHWTDKAIIDRVEQFISDNSRLPTATDFKAKGMPPHTVIKQRYKISLKEWLEVNYPRHKPTRKELKEKYTENFITEYNRIKPKTSEEFNMNKKHGTKSWQTVASYHNVKSWRGLIKSLGLPLHFDVSRSYNLENIRINVHTDI